MSALTIGRIVHYCLPADLGWVVGLVVQVKPDSDATKGPYIDLELHVPYAYNSTEARRQMGDCVIRDPATGLYHAAGNLTEGELPGNWRFPPRVAETLDLAGLAASIPIRTLPEPKP